MSATIEPALASRTQSAPIPGVYPNTDMATYHKWDAASNSRLSKLRRSPAHLRCYIETPPDDTPALAIGRAIHTAILEPDEFTARYMIADQCTASKKDGDRCANGGSLYFATHGWRCGTHAKGLGEFPDMSRAVLPVDGYTTCLGIMSSVRRHTSANGLLSGAGDAEFSVAWIDDATGLSCKARFDKHAPTIAGGAIVDVKSTGDASLREFERSIFKFGYHRQAAMYLDAARALGIDAEHFVIVAVEKEPPYAVAVYRLTDGAIDAGRDQLRPLLSLYKTCVERDQWPAYPQTVQDIALPAWAWSRIDEEVKAGTNYDTSE